MDYSRSSPYRRHLPVSEPRGLPLQHHTPTARKLKPGVRTQRPGSSLRRSLLRSTSKTELPCVLLSSAPEAQSGTCSSCNVLQPLSYRLLTLPQSETQTVLSRMKAAGTCPHESVSLDPFREGRKGGKGRRKQPAATYEYINLRLHRCSVHPTDFCLQTWQPIRELGKLELSLTQIMSNHFRYQSCLWHFTNLILKLKLK